MSKENLRHKTKVGIYWQFFSQLATYGMQFIIGVVMARMLSPEDYGITALPAVFIAIAQVFVESGFTSALIRKDECTEKDLATSLYYSLIVGLLCYGVLYFMSPCIADFYDIPILTKLTRVTALVFLISPLTTPQQVILNRRVDFKTIARVSIANKLLSGVVGIYAAYIGFGLWALVIANLTSALLLFVFNWMAVRWFPKEGWSTESFKYLWGYGGKVLLTFLIDRIYINITPIVVGKYYSTSDLGTYNRAHQYAQLPSQQITGVVQQVTFPILSKIKHDDNKLEVNYRKILRVTAFVVFPIMFLMAVLAEPFIILLVTERWAACIPYLRLMCFWLMWLPIHSLNLNLLLIKGRSDLFLRLEIIKKIVGLSIMAITLPMGIMSFIVGSIINSIISLFINTYYTGKLIHIGFLKQMLDIAPILVLCVVMAVFSYITICFLCSMWAKLLVGVSVGCFIYFGVSYLMRFSEWEEVKYMLNRKK